MQWEASLATLRMQSVRVCLWVTELFDFCHSRTLPASSVDPFAHTNRGREASLAAASK